MDPVVIQKYKEIAFVFGLTMKELLRRIQLTQDPIRHDEISSQFDRILAQHLPSKEYIVDHTPFHVMENHLGERFGRNICISVGNCVAHGKNVECIVPGEIVTIDAGIAVLPRTKLARNRRLFFDAAFTCEVGNKDLSDLAYAPLNALKKISLLKGNISVRDIATIIQQTAWASELGVVTALVGHGIGYSLHEYPGIPNAVFDRTTLKLPPHIMINPEPMYAQVRGDKIATVRLDDDGWSVMTTGLSSHWETTYYYDGDKLCDIVGMTNIDRNWKEQ